MENYLNFLFEDEECGELFFVEVVQTEDKTLEECKKEAYERANEYFEEPKMIDLMDATTAEFYGYDTY